MPMLFEERPSESPYVERIWYTQRGSGGEFTSVALNTWQLCVWTHEGKQHLTIRGPETKPTIAYCAPDADFVGVVFKVGTGLQGLLPASLVDTAVTLPQASAHRFWLGGAAWEYPTYDNVDTFIRRLTRSEMLGRDSIVDAALQGQSNDVTLRSVQRRFVQSTGLTHGSIYQIDRARQATLLLKQGVAILDVVDMLGYADQPHLTRALRRWIGQTPAQLLKQGEDAALSFLFKTLS